MGIDNKRKIIWIVGYISIIVCFLFTFICGYGQLAAVAAEDNNKKCENMATPDCAKPAPDEEISTPSEISKATDSEAEEEEEPEAEPEAEPEPDEVVLINDLLPEPHLTAASEPEAVVVTNFEEFEEAFYEGGSIIFGNDIFISKEEKFYYNVFPMRGKTLTVDTGEYSLLIAGDVSLDASGYNRQIVFCGEGKDRGVIRVMEGGQANLYSSVVEARNGCAVYQEDGGYLDTEEVSVIGDIHFSARATILMDSRAEWKTGTCLVEPGDDVETCLERDGFNKGKGYVNFKGNVTEKELPIKWDFEAASEEIANQQRVELVGICFDEDFPDAGLIGSPVCTLVFRTQPVVFLDFFIKIYPSFDGGEGTTSIRFYYTLPPYQSSVTCQWSFDGETWVDSNESQNFKEPDADHSKSRKGVGTIDFYDGKARDFRLQVSREDGVIEYSDIVRYEDQKITTADKRGGNRGGGTELLPSGRRWNDRYAQDDGGSEYDYRAEKTDKETAQQEETVTAVQVLDESPPQPETQISAGENIAEQSNAYENSGAAETDENQEDAEAETDGNQEDAETETDDGTEESDMGIDNALGEPYKPYTVVTGSRQAEETVAWYQTSAFQIAAGSAVTMAVLSFALWGHPYAWLKKFLKK